VFIADTSNHRILKFTNAGKFIRKWGSQGSDNKQYSTAYSFDVDYPEIKSDIPPGIQENGVVLFDPLNYSADNSKTKSARFQFEATRRDNYATVEFIFPVIIPK
jgi:hypothetical protein